jgi:hypothetical protein
MMEAKADDGRVSRSALQIPTRKGRTVEKTETALNQYAHRGNMRPVRGAQVGRSGED